MKRVRKVGIDFDKGMAGTSGLKLSWNFAKMYLLMLETSTTIADDLRFNGQNDYGLHRGGDHERPCPCCIGTANVRPCPDDPVRIPTYTSCAFSSPRLSAAIVLRGGDILPRRIGRRDQRSRL